MRVIARDGHGGDKRALPQILVIDFGHRDVEFVAETILQTFDGVAFVLERVRAIQVQVRESILQRRA